MAFSADWPSMFASDGSATAPPRLGIDFVAASAQETAVGGLVVRQDLAALGIAGVVWNCARVLVKFLQRDVARLSGVHVVELGAGTGAVGLALALGGAPSRLVMTDLPEVVSQLTQRNLESANAAHPALKAMADDGRLEAVPHRWGSTLDAAIVGCDVVLCSDCLYEPQAFDALLSTLTSLDPPTVFLAYKQRHSERERAFFQCVAESFDIAVWSLSSEEKNGHVTPFLNEAIYVCRLESKVAPTNPADAPDPPTAKPPPTVDA